MRRALFERRHIGERVVAYHGERRYLDLCRREFRRRLVVLNVSFLRLSVCRREFLLERRDARFLHLGTLPRCRRRCDARNTRGVNTSVKL